MKILITRPEPDGSKLARILKKMGHTARLAPLMHIDHKPGRKIDTAGVQAFLVTSANGARALGSALKSRDLSLFAVGVATAEALQHEGFKDIHIAEGDVETLANKVIEECAPEGGKLIHIAGSDVAGDLSGLLARDGFECERAVLYEALPVTSLDAKILKEIKGGAIPAALFYSPRTAAIFAGLVTAAGIVSNMENVTAYCLSKAVAEKLESLPFSGIKVAAEPNQENLLALLAAVGQAKYIEDKPDKLREREMSDKNSGKTEGAGKTAVPIAGTDNKDTASTNAELSNSEQAKPKSRVGLVLVSLIVVFCLGLAAWPLIYPKVEPYLPAGTAAIIAGQFGEAENTSDISAAFKALQEDLKSGVATLSNRIKKLEDQPTATVSSADVDSGKLTELSSDLTDKLADLSSQLEAQQTKVTSALEELKAQQESIAELKNVDPVVADPSPEIQNQIVDLKTTLLDLKTQITGLGSELATDRETVKTQSSQLSSLEGRLKAEIASKSEEATENQRTLMLLAISQLQRETRGDEPFENGLKQVTAVANSKFGGVLEKLQPIAPIGAPTMASLQKGFSSIATDISQSARLPSEETWYGQALHRIASAIKFRRIDDSGGSDVDAVVARTEQDLSENDLNNAVAEIEKLSGVAAEVAGPWLKKAKTRLTVEQSIAGLLEEATTTAITTPTSN